MKKPNPRRDKYFLRDLHREIDLYDRKLAYLNKYVDFATPADREEAEEKMLAKRASLEKAARELAASGVEFDDNELPRSFRAMHVEHNGAGKNLALVKPA
jgi:hypothetical protein